ncbi:HIT family protein [Sphingomonas crusticola]|uniref:HIT family protein n=1 Tax=Sphingomonas crusticola TaxID=1697973 RepID=UPI000E225A75|nr:HIT family protein [Sphingomonas crusticola]
MNATIQKFGYPASLVAEYMHWVVLLRPSQPTLGSLILAAKSDATAFPNLKAPAFAELATVTAHLEGVLKQAVAPAKINYLMLMMVDPHVHFHVIPRYEGGRGFSGIEVADAGWPGVPALGEARSLSPDEATKLIGWLRGWWPSGGR